MIFTALFSVGVGRRITKGRMGRSPIHRLPAGRVDGLRFAAYDACMKNTRGLLQTPTHSLAEISSLFCGFFF